MAKPDRIILIRHGESVSNVDNCIHKHTPDHRVPLTEEGKKQAFDAGVKLQQIAVCRSQLRQSSNLAGDCRFYVSPYARTRQTLDGIIKGYYHRGIVEPILLPPFVYEDPRLREQEFGHYYDVEQRKQISAERDLYGMFFYRMPSGESGADVFDRVSAFLDTMHRDFEKDYYPENAVVVSHGLTIRLFLMRWFHWTVEEFERLRNPHNCQIFVMKLYSGKYTLTTPLERYDSADTRAYMAQKEKILHPDSPE